jgi:HlyD family secretion protein/epimerase transport system membrane fusion protein
MQGSQNQLSRLVIMGWLVIFIGLGGVLAWASFTTLESAAIAQGVVEPLGGVHPVQHLEGGIIKKVHVQDGAIVNKDDRLITLDDTQARSQYERISQRLMVARFENYRLQLELGGRPWQLEAPFDSEDYAEYALSQKLLYETRRDAYQVQLEIVDQKVSELENEIMGLKEERQSAQKQAEIFAERLSDLKELVKKNMITKTERLKLEAGLAEYRGKAGRLEATIARVEQRIGQTRLNKLSLKRKRLEKLTAEVKDKQELVNDLAERLKAAADILDRKAISAEISGKVTDLIVKAPGEVIGEGKTIMQIVPLSGGMIIRAKINPDDIDVVKPGLNVDIRLTAFSARSTRLIKGKVSDVSPDRKESRGGKFYFEAMVQIDPDSFATSGKGELYPGMSAQLAIITGERSVWQYLLAPVLDSMEMSLREQ